MSGSHNPAGGAGPGHRCGRQPPAGRGRDQHPAPVRRTERLELDGRPRQVRRDPDVDRRVHPGPGPGRDPARPRGHRDPAPGVRVEREVARPHFPGAAVEHLDHRPAAGPGPGDDLGPAVPVQVGRGHRHPAAERIFVSEETADERPIPAAEHPDGRRALVAGPADDVGVPVPVHVPGRHVHPATERLLVGEEVGDQPEVGPAVHPDPRRPPPAPAPTTMSSYPSWLMSAVAIVVGPVNPGSKRRECGRHDPVRLRHH